MIASEHETNKTAVQAYIGLGSNLQNPRRQVEQAIAELDGLDGCRLLTHSPWYQSVAVGPGAQSDYINGVALLETNLPPHQLLDALQTIEQTHARVRKIHWGPRTLDLDLLLYGQHTINTERLQVPHPHLQQRNFVLYPLADLQANLVLPSGTTLESLLADCPSDGLVKIQDGAGANSEPGV